MILRILIMIGLNVGVLVLVAGWVRAAAVRAPSVTRGPARFLVLVIVGWLAVIQLVMLATGLAGVMDKVGVGVTVGLACGLSLVSGAFRRGLARLPRTVGRWAARANTPGTNTLAVAAVAFLFLNLTVATFRENQSHGWDDAAYHAIYPSLWLADGRISFQPLNLKAYYPQATGLQSVWFMLPFSPDGRADALAWVGLTGLAFDLLFVAAAAVICRKVAAPAGAWAVAGGLMLSSYIIWLRQQSFADDDVAIGSLIVAGLALALPDVRGDRVRAVLIDVIACGLVLGYAIGTKPLAAMPALPVVVLALHRLRSVLPWPRTIGVALVTTALAAFLGSFWYVRSAVLTGNPLYPASVAGLPGATTFPGTRLVDFAGFFGNREAIKLGLEAYVAFPLLWGMAALAGLGYAVAVATVRGFRPALRPFAVTTVCLSGLMLAYLPWQPFGAGWSWNISAGQVHPLSQRYIFPIAFLGWVWCGLLTVSTPAASRAGWALALTAICVGISVERTSFNLPMGDPADPHSMTRRGLVVACLLGLAVLVANGPAVVRRFARSSLPAKLAVGLIVVGLGVWGMERAHQFRAKRNAIGRDGIGIWATLGAQPPSRVWGYYYTGFFDLDPARGPDYQHELVRVDQNGRRTDQPELETDMTSVFPPAPTVTAAEFAENLRESGVGYVVVRSLPFGNRELRFPPQFDLLNQAPGVTVIFTDGVYYLFRVSPQRSEL